MSNLSIIRLLNNTDFKSVNQLVSEIDKPFYNYFLNDNESRYKVFGLFENDILKSFLSLIDNQMIPAWTFKDNLSYFKSECDFERLFFYAIKFQEQSNLFQFFTCYDIGKIEIQLNDRYQKYFENLIEKNKLSGYENVDHDILDYKIVSFDRVIYHWILRNEYRSI